MKQYIPDLDADIQRITHHYGLASQLSIAQEECAELIQAISKLERAYQMRTDCDAACVEKTRLMRVAKEHVSEEMGDVLLMLWQLMCFFDNADDVMLWLQRKVKRTLEKIAKEADHETRP